MDYEYVIVGALETNCYLVYCEKTRECAVVDPGAEPNKIIQLIAEKEFKPIILINTHGHVDHIGANRDIKEKYDIPLCIHSSDEKMLGSILTSGLGFVLGARSSPSADRHLEDGGEIDIGKSRLKVIHTPGHSPGSVSLLGEGFLLSGDTLFCGGVGRTDLPGGSWTELKNSIEKKILTFPDDMVVLPGHGPATTVGQEKDENPYIQ
jgi:hydroxyacylglutathione hydrolase